jgi:hypothetical protein
MLFLLMRMKKMANRRLGRSYGHRSYRKIFIIASEGRVTESDYFSILDNDQVHIKIVKGKDRSPPDAVLKRMQDYIKNEKLRKEKSDQYWVVIDKDNWLDQQIQPLLDWSVESENYSFALSNPKFEYWLLLHFEDGKSASSPRKILERLKQYLPDYKKGLDDTALQKLAALLRKAINNAKKKDVPPCSDWPKINGTTVYRLVEEILKQGS